MIADNKAAAIGCDASNSGLFAGTCSGELATTIEIDDADAVGRGVNNVCAVTGRVDGDEVRLVMDSNRGDDAIGVCVDHRDRTGLAVGDVDLIENRIYGQAPRIGAHLEGPVLTQVDKIKDCDGIRAAIADVSVLPVAVGNVRETAAVTARDADQERGSGKSATKEKTVVRRGHYSESI